MSVVRLFTISTVTGAVSATPADRSPVHVTVSATVTQPAKAGCDAQQNSAQAAAELNRSVFRLEASASRADPALFLDVVRGAPKKWRRKDIIPIPNTLNEFAEKLCQIITYLQLLVAHPDYPRMGPETQCLHAQHQNW
jgi:hypothetical protein